VTTDYTINQYYVENFPLSKAYVIYMAFQELALLLYSDDCHYTDTLLFIILRLMATVEIEARAF
jgi:hypothetical protein